MVWKRKASNHTKQEPSTTAFSLLISNSGTDGQVYWGRWEPCIRPLFLLHCQPFLCFPSSYTTASPQSYFLNFYWSIVDLQCCVSFRCTAKWISYTYTYSHSFLDSFPIQIITETWVEFPVLYSRSLVIYVLTVCIRQSQSPNLSLPPLSTLVTSLFSTSVTLFLFCK